MNIPLISTLSLLFISLSTYSFSAQAEINDARLLASQCAQCHGTDGYSRTGIDSLAGKDDIAEEMLEMQVEVDDDDDIMVKQAHGYSRAEIILIGQYFASLPRNNPNQEDNNSGQDNDRDDDDNSGEDNDRDDDDNSGKDNDRDDDDSGKDNDRDDDDNSSKDKDDNSSDVDRNFDADNSNNEVRNIRWWLRWD